MADDAVPTYTLIQADGLYPDDTVEQEIFAPRPGQNYKLEFISTGLWPTGTSELAKKPWSAIPEDVRNRIDGIMVLKIGFTEQDVELFPKLKV
ncbi:hypothetical protein CLAFUW4_05793 [Fulvia fulva]|uniref:Uncharacterized protein n=1 Tax=Passalora fulva TaxID=5499 RepID=A0A9Q8LJ18_PASFU|nr:uncharacterized protein CLAFUR5_05934 [Fulvia fulva]KAK4624599.1 hypothetical protein CLAFUR4_05787 [Fulvia fulva]KAK4624798.1 hypothetical protein CLAFUR0_05798 [Fulvia fulva]UJO18039.1 hypothetical protein CLAFUR5_05934 [Fulvia fulva]WPV14763.1 hypothetical protein CLAFUW4_05793 [Fulvia fulva]WPV30273.1 hypothetical protein CLAFUW7_05791 [Fulvia fulva]